MKRHVLLTVAVLAVGLCGWNSVAQAQTGTTTPPRADALLPSALLATLLQNTVHLDGTLQMTGGGTSALTLPFTGDLAWTGTPRGQFTVTVPAGLLGSGSGTSTALFKGKYIAAQSGNGTWQCTNLGNALTSTGSTSVISGTDTETGGMTALPLPKLGAPQTVGATTIDGTPVWQVHVPSTPATSKDKTTTESLAIDLYIDQADLLYRRMVVTDAVTQNGTPSTMTVTLNLSQYGAPVTITLPAACNGKKAHKTSMAKVLRRLEKAVPAIAQPLRVLSQVEKLLRG